MQRRDLLRGLVAAGLFSATPARLLRAETAIRFKDDPFTLGVASGSPRPDSVVLWTRLAPRPLEPRGGMDGAVVPVEWELAADDGFRNVVQSGTAYAAPEWAHSVHVEPVGLEPGRPYWYRFTAGRARSAVGRTATAPARGAMIDRLRLNVASCQHYEHGYYVAYRQMVEDQPDLVVHVGDYIYELSWGRQEDFVRRHGASECYTLDDYRARYALYKGDADLQAAHAMCPWLVTWDDHEVDNDYANDISEEDDVPELLLARRAAAYQAYYEHMPLPRRGVPFGPNMRLHMEHAFGGLANILTLDERQYRSPQACPQPGRRGSNRVSNCAELTAPERTKLGARQEAWLEARLAASKSRWNVLAQGTVMAYIDEMPGPGERFWTDGWNGYPAARERLLESAVRSGAANPVVLSGDIHAFAVARLNRSPSDPSSPVIASEFTTTSITSQSVSQKAIDERKAENPSLLLANAERRGYLRLELTPASLRADLVAMDSVAEPTARGAVMASFVVEDGRPGPIPASG